MITYTLWAGLYKGLAGIVKEKERQNFHMESCSLDKKIQTRLELPMSEKSLNLKSKF